MMNKLYNATSSKKEKVSIKGAQHSNSDLVQSQIYWTTISEFLNKYM